MIIMMMLMMFFPYPVNSLNNRNNLYMIVHFILVRIFRNIDPIMEEVLVKIMEPKIKKRVKDLIWTIKNPAMVES